MRMKETETADVAPGDGDGDSGYEEYEESGGNAVAGGIAQKEICVVIEAPDYACARSYVGEKEAPGGGSAEGGRKDHGGVGVERTGGGGVAGEFSHAKGDKENSDSGQNVSEPGAVAGEGTDERDCGCGSGGRRNRGDGLRECFHG
jgi:hypothetical protein